MKEHIQPLVSIVGAGPGDPDLISVKGLKAIQKAPVILYDALVNPILLQEAKKDALKIFVGKRAGAHYKSQDQINSLIVEYALRYGHVVRLKGGDPFVFGRGHEELVFARRFNLRVEIVPGISSCIAVPELQGIPLTRRGINESFWVLTGTTKNGQLSTDIPIAVKSSASLVILMGLGKLHQIVGLLTKENKNDCPIMIVQNGSREDEKFVIGKVQDIEEKVKEAGIGTPAIILIGNVVNLHPTLNYASIERSSIPSPN